MGAAEVERQLSKAAGVRGGAAATGEVQNRGTQTPDGVVAIATNLACLRAA